MGISRLILYRGPHCKYHFTLGKGGVFWVPSLASRKMILKKRSDATYEKLTPIYYALVQFS